MRVFLFISEKGDSISLAQRIVDEGNRVQFYINNPDTREIGDGLIEKHRERGILVSGNGHINPEVFSSLSNPLPDCIICDSCSIGFGDVSDMFRNAGIPVIGSNEWAERVDNDEVFGLQVMLTMGVDVTKEFAGIKVNIEAWFNGVDVVGVNYSIKSNTLMPNDIGPKVEMGNVVWIGSQGSLLYKESLEKLIPLLKKLKYRGPISMDVNINENRFYGIRLMPKINFNSIFTLLEMLKGKVNDLFYGMATGVIKNMNFKSPIGMGITIGIPPFPYSSFESQPYDIKGLNKHNLKHFWGYAFKDGYTSCGKGGYIGTVTARGDDIQGFSPIRDARRRALRTIGNIEILDKMYRTDIGVNVEQEKAQLKKWGWL